MKKIFCGLALLVLVFSKTSFAKEENIYCYHTEGRFTSQHNKDLSGEAGCGYKGVLIPKSVYQKIENVESYYYTKGMQDDPENSAFFKKKSLSANPKFIKEREEAVEKVYLESKNEIRLFQVELDKELKDEINKKKQLRTTELEKLYAGKCNWGYTKGTEKYNNCLLEQEKKDLAEQKKKQDLAEANKKKLETEAKQAADKIAKMSPDDRRAYICNEKYGFRKGSDNFKDCIFKIYTAEIELEKLELQKQLAKANADLAKVNAASREKLANAQTNAAIMQAYAAQQQAIAANTADSLALMESGLRMMSPQRPATRAPMNCQYHANMLSCF